ncbi:MAG: SDR family oxidoreductase [Candidatus Eremiobacteraeota bacterium]|nr:SDR family oxidoreductase [Candidatus Eremiobacteraeota bacterium]
MISEAGALAGKTILVTGGSMGIGFACATACRAAGANVVLAARGAAVLAESAARLAQLKGSGYVETVAGDVGEEADVEEFFARAIARFDRCDGVIHAAGVMGPVGSITDVDSNAWLETIRINLFGTFLITRVAARHMRAAGGGRIVLFSGGGASTPFPDHTAYACSKVAVVRFTETVAKELAPLVEINCLGPGLVATRLALDAQSSAEKLRGAVSPEVGASAALFLVSDAAKGITGRFVAAQYDDYRSWKSRGVPLDDGDLFTLRRVVPRDRNLDWQ